MRALVSLPFLIVTATASAGESLDVQVKNEAARFFSGVDEEENKKLPRFAFVAHGFAISPSTLSDARGTVDDVANTSKKKTTVAISTDRTAAWIATDLETWMVCGDSPKCYTGKPDGQLHLTALFEVKGLAPVAWHAGEPITAADQKLAMSKGPMLDALPKKIDAGAEAVAKLFETSLADPKQLAATVSARKDVVLYGSALAERYVGGAAVKKQLQKWNLVFKPQNGIQAGITSSKTVAWVAAHVDAVPVKNPKAKATPYRLLAIYEKVGADWKLVSAHFSFTVN